ncbi:sensor histidine kinase, partial [Turicibacter sanguinis]|nr:sensor histidine kinase [Turicibacter sanguinis]
HKLSIGIHLDSEVNKGTTVKLIFPQGNLLIFK